MDPQDLALWQAPALPPLWILLLLRTFFLVRERSMSIFLTNQSTCIKNFNLCLIYHHDVLLPKYKEKKSFFTNVDSNINSTLKVIDIKNFTKWTCKYVKTAYR